MGEVTADRMSPKGGGPALRPAHPRTRFQASLKTIAHAHRMRMRARRYRLRLSPKGSEIKGFIDRLEVAEGQMRIGGWTTAKRIRFSTEVESIEVSPDIARHDLRGEGGGAGFDLVVAGSAHLVVGLDDGKDLHIAPLRPDQIVWNALRFAATLIGVPVTRASDLWAYAVKGDGAAGTRLERMLVPEQRLHAIPEAAPGLFAAGTAELATPAPVDIVVPVYDGLADTRRCLDALDRHTPPEHRVILIDDASPDPGIRPLLEGFVARRMGTRLIVHERNRGFIKAVNAGFDLAEGHVVLLNTDAFVPERWIERLMAPILANDAVASVTPMSNNAEILTAPLDCKPMPLRPGQAEAIDAAARQLNPGAARADLPTGVGFCMALSRRWLSQVPEFDTRFGRGYGEEVDWCRKTAALGARHVGIGSLFVEHRGGVSFGPEKAERIAQNNRKIASRYPGYDASVSAFRVADPLVGPRLALGLAAIASDAQVPVYLAHRMGGGAEIWLRHKIKRELKHHHAVIVVRPGNLTEQALIELHRPEGETTALVPIEDVGNYLSLAGPKDLVYSCLVSAHDPLGLLNAATETLTAADRFAILLHDFFPLCPSHNLVGVGGRFCDLPEPAACQSCYTRLSIGTSARPGSIGTWREAWSAALDRADEVVTFSEDSRSHLLKVWPALVGKTRVKPHEPPTVPRAVTVSPGAPEVIGVLGGIGYPKGAGVLKGLAGLKEHELRFAVIGKLDPAYRHKAIKVHGPYSHSEIADLAERYGVTRWFIPSIWPETFSFATRECIATGLPVFAFDIGAQGEAVKAAPNGHAIPIEAGLEEIAERLMASLN